MNKKIIIICAALFMVSCLTGCARVYDLTEDETRLIAEYASTVLLRHDSNYTDRLDVEDSSKVTTEATTEEAMEEATQEDMDEVPSDTGKNRGDMSGEKEEAIESAQTLDGVDIAKAMNQEDVSITYVDYMITQQYPTKDEDGSFMNLDASEGYELLVVRFQVMNHTEQPVDLSLIDENIDYKLVCNGTKTAKPMLTLLMEDLGTLEMTVNPSEPQEVVLVFQISDSMKESIEDLELYIQYNENNSRLELK